MDTINLILGSQDEFLKYLQTLGPMKWKPTGIVVHNTANPTIKSFVSSKVRVPQRLINWKSYYENEKKWSGGPHLFITPRHLLTPPSICVFNPLTESGIHSPSYNDTHFGVEIVGNFTSEDFQSLNPRITEVREMSIKAIAALAFHFKIDTSKIVLHKEDPETTHKDCPGKTLVKSILIDSIRREKIRLMGEL